MASFRCQRDCPKPPSRSFAKNQLQAPSVRSGKVLASDRLARRGRRRRSDGHPRVVNQGPRRTLQVFVGPYTADVERGFKEGIEIRLRRQLRALEQEGLESNRTATFESSIDIGPPGE